METVELGRINRRFEGTRLVDPVREQLLLHSIAKHGLKESLGCVMTGDRVTLLDGFKRLRCCIKLKLMIAPVRLIAVDEVSGILGLLRTAQTRQMSPLEEAALVDTLRNTYGYSVMAIAHELGRSPAWVRVRAGCIEQMSDRARVHVFNGTFPVRSYLYTLRRFTRVHRASWKSIDSFVDAVSGKQFSTRDIEVLARAYFDGDATFQEQLCHGNVVWTLDRLKQRGYDQGQKYEEDERKILDDLDMVVRHSKRARCGLGALRQRGAPFAQAVCIRIEAIPREVPAYQKAREELYAYRGSQKSDMDTF